MMNVVHINDDDKLFDLDALFSAWGIFRRGKTRKMDIMNFEMHLEDNLFCLYEEIKNNSYKHSPYTYFQIFDNKKRNIYKATVRDRIVHQIVYTYLSSFFESSFISDSYASRTEKGQYKAIKTFCYFIKLENNDNKGCYVLKCDVKKYFDNIDHAVLFQLVKRKVVSKMFLEIIEKIIQSYSSPSGIHKGIPLGNITSQIFANIYLDILDIYIKKTLRCRFYVRYNDDFVLISKNKEYLEKTREKIISFVKEQLFLEIPLEKTSIRKVAWGIDFLGFTILPHAILLGHKTKNKIYKNINQENIYSYLSILKHCDSYNLRRKIFVKKIKRT